MVVPLSTIQRNQALANQMLGQALTVQPIMRPLQGIAQLAQAFSGNILANRAERQQEERDAAAQDALAVLMGSPSLGAPVELLAGSVASSAPAAAPSPGPGLPEIMQFRQEFPEMAGLTDPLMAAALEPEAGRYTPIEDPTALGLPAGTVAQMSPTGQVSVISTPESDVVSPEREAQLIRLAEARREPDFRLESRTLPSGEVVTVVARGGAPELSKTTAGKLEQGITQAVERLDRIGQIRENLDESVLNLPEQVKQRGLALFERMGGTLNPKQREGLTRFTRARTTTIRNLNRTLNELSGAAISPAEAERLKAELPTMDDSPTEFMAKVETIEEGLQAAIRRNQQLLDSGVRGLTFNRAGEVEGAPDLETFLLLESERPVEAGMGVPPPPPGFTEVLE